jgi:hypothetical protein
MKHVLSTLALVVLAGCAGGGGMSRSSLPASLPTPTPAPGTTAPQQSASVVLRLVIPARSIQRSARYVSPSSNSLSFAQTGGPTTVAPIGPTSPNCTTDGSGRRTCTVSVSATSGANQTFAIKTFASTDGTGTPLSAAMLVATIVPLALNTISATLNGVVASITVSTGVTSLDYGVTGSTSVIVNALDASGNTIVGPGTYGDANGNPITIALADSDATHSATLSAATVTAPGTAVTLRYNGGATVKATITGSATGATSGSATVAFACAAAPPTNALYVSDFVAPGNGTVTYGVAHYAPTASGTNPAQAGNYSVPSGFFPTLAIDSSGSTYVSLYDSTGAVEAIGTYCPDAQGAPPPFRSLVPQNPFEGHIALDSARNEYTVDGAARLDEYPAGAGVVGFPTTSTPPVAPIRSITGSNTGMHFPTGLAVEAGGTAFVGNSGQITAYAATASGNAVPERTITNTAAGLLGALDTAVDASGNVYVLYFADNHTAASDLTNPYGPYALAEYAPNATTPSRIISGPATQLGTYFGAPGEHQNVLHFDNEPEMTVDPAGNIYVASTALAPQGSGQTTDVEIAVFNGTVSGNMAPTRTIDVNTAIHGYGVRPLALAADSSGNVYVGDENGFGVLVFNASGAYVRTIPPAVGGIGIVPGLALDGSGNLVLQSIAYPAANGTTIGRTGLFVYPPGAGSGTAPTKTVTNGNTIEPYEDNTGNNRIALDAAGHVYEATNVFEEPAVPTAFYGHEVSEYSTSAANNAAPINVFTDPHAAEDTQHGIGLDPQGRVYVSSYGYNVVNAYVAGTAGSSAVPAANYSDYAASTIDANGLALDAANTLYGVSCDSNSVSAYANGTGPAARSIVGTRTGLLCPSAVAVDSTGSLYVLDTNGVSTFGPAASGNVAPSRHFDASYFPTFVGTFFFDLAVGPGTIAPSMQNRSSLGRPARNSVRSRPPLVGARAAACRRAVSTSTPAIVSSRPATARRTEALAPEKVCR